MHAIIVKQGFAVIVAFCYNTCLFRNPVITTLKVVGCDDCVQENKLPVWGPGGKAPAAGQFLQFFQKKLPFKRHLDYTLLAKLLRFEKS